MTTPLRLHPEAREERRRVMRRMRDPRAAKRFRLAVDGIFDRIEESPEQFADHGLLAAPGLASSQGGAFQRRQRGRVPKKPWQTASRVLLAHAGRIRHGVRECLVVPVAVLAEWCRGSQQHAQILKLGL